MTAVPVATKPVGVGWDPRRYFGGFWRHPFARAVLKAVLTVWVTTTLTFFLIRLMPGNPVELKIDELIQTANGALTYDDAKAIASGLFAIDLNAPLHEQYLSFIGSLLRLDLGRSFLSSGTTVTSIILAVLPWTLFSVGTGLLLSFVAGIFLGLLAAYRRNSLLDRIASTGGSLVSSIPNYNLALLIILFAGVQWHLINFTSMRGAYTSGLEPGFTPAFIADIFYHAALPITIYFLTPLGHWILSMRSATLSALEEDYVTAARARGLSDGRIRTAYVGRNAVLPLVTQLAISVGFIVGGAAVIEQLFAYQGVGKRLLDSVTQRDYPVIQGVVLLTTISVVVANLAADLLYSKLDPRIGRAGGAAG
ncbi:MAG: ABC transporter permease [Chloroflexi bacterium]|nr:MAG: ABC transporter permease [Chloroflexota bacterium]TMG70220.1 MAG: ABC transporter permease [Chloroflexota bacterium]